jgi:hypothetical protein
MPEYTRDQIDSFGQSTLKTIQEALDFLLKDSIEALVEKTGCNALLLITQLINELLAQRNNFQQNTSALHHYIQDIYDAIIRDAIEKIVSCLFLNDPLLAKQITRQAISTDKFYTDHQLLCVVRDCTAVYLKKAAKPSYLDRVYEALKKEYEEENPGERYYLVGCHVTQPLVTFLNHIKDPSREPPLALRSVRPHIPGTVHRGATRAVSTRPAQVIFPRTEQPTLFPMQRQYLPPAVTARLLVVCPQNELTNLQGIIWVMFYLAHHFNLYEHKMHIKENTVSRFNMNDRSYDIKIREFTPDNPNSLHYEGNTPADLLVLYRLAPQRMNEFVSQVEQQDHHRHIALMSNSVHTARLHPRYPTLGNPTTERHGNVSTFFQAVESTFTRELTPRITSARNGR